MAIAAVRSEILLVVRDPPDFEGPPELPPTPPCRLGLLVFDRTFGSISDRTGPEAEGGGFEGAAGFGEWAREEAEDPGAESTDECAVGLLADI
jgi:hypothetical protein